MSRQIGWSTNSDSPYLLTILPRMKNQIAASRSHNISLHAILSLVFSSFSRPTRRKIHRRTGKTIFKPPTSFKKKKKPLNTSKSSRTWRCLVRNNCYTFPTIMHSRVHHTRCSLHNICNSRAIKSVGPSWFIIMVYF